jgi:hypothetical protein
LLPDSIVKRLWVCNCADALRFALIARSKVRCLEDTVD